MVKVCPESTHESSIQVKVEIDVTAGGRSEIDGKPGPTGHRFVRITDDNVGRGSWLLNPSTNEVHKVTSYGDGCLSIDTKGGSRIVPIEMAKDMLLLVESR